MEYKIEKKYSHDGYEFFVITGGLPISLWESEPFKDDTQETIARKRTEKVLRTINLVLISAGVRDAVIQSQY